MADKKTDHGDLLKEALERYDAARSREGDNIDLAYEDLEFSHATGEQWDAKSKKERQAEGRPCLTIPRIPQFVRQVTGDMRQNKPSIKVVPVDDKGDRDTADTMAGMIRYIENRSDAQQVYMVSADSQVRAGRGHWQITTEYSADTTFNQEIRILSVEDGVGVMWDPDAVLPTKEDAMWCMVPVDVSAAAFKKRWPDAPAEDFQSVDHKHAEGWYSEDYVRVCRYWVKKPIKRLLALSEGGGIDDLTDKPDEVQAFEAAGARIEKRDGFKICHYLITSAHVLEGPLDWPGRYIPVVPVRGEETRIGRKVIWNGIVRALKDSQRMYNFFRSAQTELVATQPKAPFIGTEKNFQNHQAFWQTANQRNWPYLPFTPDPTNGGAPPQRSAPPIASTALHEGVALAAEDMKAVAGIYDASLGARSNETSGRAIMARQREGDTGTFVYLDNFALAIKYTGRILVDLIPHIYDTQRMIRVMGDDGKVDLQWINKSIPSGEMDPETGEMGQIILNDVTTGAYDVVIETGPSYTTKRQEAKEGMMQFLQSIPDIGPIIGDLVAKAQDWPLAEEIGKRMEAVLPPPVKAIIDAEKQGQEGGMPGGQPPQPPPVDPAMQAQMQAQQMEMEAAQAKMQQELQLGQLDVQIKEIELLIKQAGLQQAMAAPPPQQPGTSGEAKPKTQQAAEPSGDMDQVVQAIQYIAQGQDQILQSIDQLAQVLMGQMQPPEPTVPEMDMGMMPQQGGPPPPQFAPQ